MLTETFLAATEAVNKPSAHLASALKDVGIYHYEIQPQNTLRHGYKKTSIKSNCLTFSDSHIFAAQANKAVINVYNRQRGNQEATVPFPDKIHSLVYAQKAATLIIGSADGKLVLWEVATGRITTTVASHLEAVSSLAVTNGNDQIISGSADTTIHVWSLAQLLSFSSQTQSYDNTQPKDAPSRTFSYHRATITALAVGSSYTSTNFAVSTSADRTCYLWHIQTCQILRTFLTTGTSISIVLNPADRAIYLGNDNGSIQSIDLFDTAQQRSKKSIYDTTDEAPIQITADQTWITTSSDAGAANSLTLSYDGTTLLSGHSGGSIIRWDVAKKRIVSELANLYQPVTCIQMIVPEGLQHKKPHFILPVVVKPRLELNAESTESTVGLPPSYSLTAQIVRPTSSLGLSNALTSVLEGALFPDSMLDDAIQAMIAKPAGVSSTASTTPAASNKSDTYHIQALEDEKASLEKQLAAMQKLHYEARERHRKRSERRDKIGAERREAYFAAKKMGKDGDVAMKPYEKRLEAIDVESDEEELRVSDQIGGNGEVDADVEMDGAA